MSGYSPMCFECDRPAWICARDGHHSASHELWCARQLTGGAEACDCFGADLELAPNQPQREPLPALAEELL